MQARNVTLLSNLLLKFYSFTFLKKLHKLLIMLSLIVSFVISRISVNTASLIIFSHITD